MSAKKGEEVPFHPPISRTSVTVRDQRSPAAVPLVDREIDRLVVAVEVDGPEGSRFHSALALSIPVK
jgi:hypothetical protein